MPALFASSAYAPVRHAAHPGGLSDMFDELAYNVNRDSAQEGVKLGVLMSAVGRRSYGPLLLVIGLFSISPATVLPGMTSVAAFMTLLVAGQMALGLQRPWLPKRILEIRVPRRMLFQFIDSARPKVEAIDGVWLRQRWSFLTVPLFVNLVALCVMAAALITFPLSFIPFAPIAPGLAVVLFGLGMTARDGLWLAVGVSMTATIVLLALPVLF